MSERTIQDEALDKALQQLGEHFDNVVIVCDAPDVEFPDEDAPSIFHRRKGSTWTAVGMMETFRKLLLDAFVRTCRRQDDTSNEE